MSSAAVSDADRDRVRALLGREPRGEYSIVVRDESGDPVVLQNAPLLDDGTPMPTRYWLIGPQQHRLIGQLESSGGVNAAEAAIEPDVLAAAHQRYAMERDQALPVGYEGPLPSGGVGGTRVGVKCLHAHWAWYLAGGDDPVGAWIADQLQSAHPESAHEVGDDSATSDLSTSHLATSELADIPVSRIVVDATATVVSGPALNDNVTIPWGSANLTTRWLMDADPPHPADLTNALGTIDDELDDIVRTNPTWSPGDNLTFAGAGISALVALELGLSELPASITMDRTVVEELFRLTATAPASERAENPGLPLQHVSDIVAVCCIVLAVMRRFQLDHASFDTSTPAVLAPGGVG